MALERKFKKILAIKFRSLGDTVLLSASLGELHRAFPGAEIHVAVLNAWAPLLESHPGIRKVWRYERHNDKLSRAKALARLALSLTREKYDCVVNFHASPSSALLAFATTAPTRSIHFHGHRDKNRYSTVLIPDKGTLKPVIERDMDTVRALGVTCATGRLPEVVLKPAERNQEFERLKSLGLEKRLLGVGLGASRPTKNWSPTKFAEVATQWIRENSGSVLVVIAPTESPLAIEFMKAIPAELHSKVLVEKGSPIRQVASLLSFCSVFVGNDSGPKHLAIAVQVPTVTVFGPEHPFEWHPYPREKHPYFFIESLTCRKDGDPGKPAWCGLHTCVTERHRCMEEISMEQVFAECRKVSRQ